MIKFIINNTLILDIISNIIKFSTNIILGRSMKTNTHDLTIFQFLTGIKRRRKKRSEECGCGNEERPHHISGSWCFQPQSKGKLKKIKIKIKPK